MPLIKFVCSSGQKCKTKNNGWTDSWIHGCKGGKKDGSSHKPPLGSKNSTTAAESPAESHQSPPVLYVLAEKQ